jgi:hypothetical protein
LGSTFNPRLKKYRCQHSNLPSPNYTQGTPPGRGFMKAEQGIIFLLPRISVLITKNNARVM